MSSDSSRVQPNKSVELWSTIHEVVMRVWTYPSRLFRQTIFRPLGELPVEIFTRARVWPSLGSAHRNRGRDPLKNFKGPTFEIGLKFYTWAPITLGVVGVPSRNFTRRTLLEAGVIKWTLIFKGVLPTRFGRQKNVHNSARFLTTFDFITHISGMDRHIENRKSTWSTTFHPLLSEKELVYFGPLIIKL